MDTTDSLMHRIAREPIAWHVHNGNACSKNNIQVIKDVLNFLAYNLTFNEFVPRAKFNLNDEEIRDAVRESVPILQHNHAILVHYVRSHDEEVFDQLFPTVLIGDDAVTILQRRRTVMDKLTKGGLITSHVPIRERGSPAPVTSLWIHHLFFFQFLVPIMNDDIQRGLTYLSGYEARGGDDFLTLIRLPFMPGYGSRDGVKVIMAAWMGSDGYM